MRLVYESNGEEVKVGDKVEIFRGDPVTVVSFREPHKPGSSGKIIVQDLDHQNEFYVGVIGAKWIEREDR